MDHASTLRDLFQQTERPARSPEPGPAGPVADEEPTTRDDTNRLEALFGRPRQAPASPRADRSKRDGPWPQHNYNEAYHQIARQRPRARRSQSPDESTLWEIQELLEEDHEASEEIPPPSGIAEPTPWPDHKGLDLRLMEHAFQDAPPEMGASGPHDSAKWLDALTEDPPLPTTTEARLIGTLRGDTDIVRRPLFDTTETLWATEPGRRAGTTAEPAPETKGKLLARPRALLLKIAGIVLGLKVGISAGYLLATLL